VKDRFADNMSAELVFIPEGSTALSPERCAAFHFLSSWHLCYTPFEKLPLAGVLFPELCHPEPFPKKKPRKYGLKLFSPTFLALVSLNLVQ
jgi:hypothetical protein